MAEPNPTVPTRPALTRAWSQDSLCDEVAVKPAGFIGASINKIRSVLKPPPSYPSHTPILERLGIDENYESDDTSRDDTALLVACAHGDVKGVSALLDRGASPNAHTKELVSALDVCLLSEGPKSAKIIELLLSQRCINVTHEDCDKNTVLHRIQASTAVSTVSRLVDAGAPYDAKNDREQTPILTAVRVDNVEVAKFLIERGANIHGNPHYFNFGSLLQIACCTNSIEMVKLLCDNGISTEMVDHETGDTVLHTTIRATAGRIRSGDLIERGKSSEHAQVLRYLVEDRKFPLNAKSGLCDYPLLYAAEHAATPHMAYVMKYLIRQGASVDVVDDEGCGVVHHAAMAPCWKALELLEQLGLDLTCRDDHGRLPIHIAAREGNHGDTVAFLLKRLDKFGVNVTDYSGWTLLQFAVINGKSDGLVKLLLDNGVSFNRQAKHCFEHEIRELCKRRPQDLRARLERAWMADVPLNG